MSVTTHATYDAVPYHSDPFPQTHPRHLATIARLFGLESPPVSRCRVLELGCAAGGNLVPMAQDLTESEFVGVDLSIRQIEDGLQDIRSLGLKNVQLHHASITDVDDSFGKFDYIICHGVYSWVPANVQDKILAICKQNLTPRGVAYVSYNTYPGWHLRGVVRDMMRYHVEQFNDPGTKIKQARLLLDFLVKSAASGTEAYGAVLADEADILRRHTDTYLFHEHLEENNLPVYFCEFAARAERAGLQYLGESEFSSMLARNLPAEAYQMLQSVPIMRQEQYMDFLRNRMFRRTLLCHDDITLVRNVPARRLTEFFLSVPSRLEHQAIDFESDAPVQFRCLRGTATLRLPISKAALVHLHESYPQSVHFSELFKAAMDRLDLQQQAKERDSLEDDLANDLMTIFAGGMLQASITAPQFTLRIADYPVASPLARLQAATTSRVTNRRHEPVVLEGFSRHVIHRLDGNHDRRRLLHSMRSSIARGELEITQGDKRVSHIDEPVLRNILDATLRTLAKNALLVA